MSTIFPKNISSWHPNDTIASTSVGEEFLNIYTLLQGEIDDANVSGLSIGKIVNLQDTLNSKASTAALQTGLNAKADAGSVTWSTLPGKPSFNSITYGHVEGTAVTYGGTRALSATQQGLNNPSRLVHNIGNTNYVVQITPTNGFYIPAVTKYATYCDVSFKANDFGNFSIVPYDVTIVEL